MMRHAGDFALSIVLAVALGSALLRCGSPAPSTEPPPAVDAGHTCNASTAAACCDAGRWSCTTLNVPCECPP